MFPASGVGNVRTTVFVPVAVAEVGTGVPLTSAVAACFLIRLKVNATSAALNAWPSLHFTPDRVVKVRVLASDDHWKAVASIGTGAWVGCIRLNRNSGSEMR